MKVADPRERIPAVSVVIPVYNEEAILESSVELLHRGLSEAGLAFEIILAENGSRDRTLELARALEERHPEVVALSCPEPNYGAALRSGIRRAQGRNVVCEEIDLCDLGFQLTALEMLDTEGVDLVVGSKAMKGARDRRPLSRRAATRMYNGLLRVSLGFSGTDTHGLKAFRREALLPVVEACTVEHDVFASELVIRASRAGLRCREIPIDLEERRPPSINLSRRVPRVLKNLGMLWVSIHLVNRRGQGRPP